MDTSLPCVKSIRATQRPLQILFRVQCFGTPPGCHSDIGLTGHREPEELHTASMKSTQPPRKFSCCVVLQHGIKVDLKVSFDTDEQKKTL